MCAGFRVAQGGGTQSTSDQGDPPSPLRLAVIAKAHVDDVRLPYVPAFAQKVALATGAALGRLARFESTYEPTGSRQLEPALAG